jgi:hypothetical protein
MSVPFKLSLIRMLGCITVLLNVWVVSLMVLLSLGCQGPSVGTIRDDGSFIHQPGTGVPTCLMARTNLDGTVWLVATNEPYMVPYVR